MDGPSSWGVVYLTPEEIKALKNWDDYKRVRKETGAEGALADYLTKVTYVKSCSTVLYIGLVGGSNSGYDPFSALTLTLYVHHHHPLINLFLRLSRYHGAEVNGDDKRGSIPLWRVMVQGKRRCVL